MNSYQKTKVADEHHCQFEYICEHGCMLEYEAKEVRSPDRTFCLRKMHDEAEHMTVGVPFLNTVPEMLVHSTL